MITVPFTPRFQLVGPAALASPFMPLLTPHASLEYTVAFVRPHAGESDFVWGDFQDQVVIQTRLSKLVVELQALKDATDDAEPTLFFPQSLPSVKAPALKLFEYIEKTHRHDTNNQATRRLDVVSESFNSAKNKGESALEPIPSRSVAAPSSCCSSNPTASLADAAQVPPHSLTTDVNTQAEAKAVILRLRARNSTRSGTTAAAAATTPIDESSRVSTKPDEVFPESRLDATTRAELDAFHQLVVGAKDGVMREQVEAKSELEYYRQFLPQASAADSITNESTPRELQPSSDVIAPSLQPLARRSAVSACPAAPAASAPLKFAKSTQGMKVTGKLPTLSSVSSASMAAAAGSPELSSEGESNQETSPVRKSVALATKQPPSSSLPSSSARQAVLSSKSSSASAMAMAREARAKGAGNNTAAPLSQCASSRADIVRQPKSAALRAKPLVSGASKTLKQQTMTSRDHPEAALSDFDDPDPDVDDAPVLPDDLIGMRSTACSGYDDDDEY